MNDRDKNKAPLRRKDPKKAKSFLDKVTKKL